MFIRPGVRLLEERQGDGDALQRQREYILSIRFTLNQGEVLTSPAWWSSLEPSEESPGDGFFEHRLRIDRMDLIPGLFYAVQGMRVGGYRKVAISPHLAYGDKGLSNQIPPNAKLIAEIKVLRKVVERRLHHEEREIPEAEVFTQDQLCERYGITRPMLWRWRKEGRLPEPVVIGRLVRWRRSAIEQWEAVGRPHTSPCLDETNEQRDRAFARRIPEADQDYRRYLLIELALLIDEAGQWGGPSVALFLEYDSVAPGLWQGLANVVQKTLSRAD